MATKKKGNIHQVFIESLSYVLVSVLIAMILFGVPTIHEAILAIAGLGYTGAFLAGIFFVSIFTAAPALVVLLTMAETLPIFWVSVFAAFGSIIGDILIISIFRRGIRHGHEMLPKEHSILKSIRLLRHSRYRFIMTLVGAIVVASPLPDELGLALMGLTSMKTKQLLLIAFLLNFVGLFLILALV